MLPNSVDHIALIYALILSGAVWVPVNVRLRGAGLSHVVRHSQACTVDLRAGVRGSRVRAPRCCQPPASTRCSALPIRSIRPTWSAPPGSLRSTRCASSTRRAPPAPRRASCSRIACYGLRARRRSWSRTSNQATGSSCGKPLCHIGGAQMLIAPFLADVQLHVVERFSTARFWTQWMSARATHLHYLGGVLNLLMRLPECRNS